MKKAQFNRAFALHKQGELEEAKKLYLEILGSDPNQADILHLLGILLAQQKQFKEAEQYILSALKLDSQNYTYENSLGNVYKNLNDFENAKIHYALALKIKPDYAVAYNNFANIEYLLKNYDLAEKYYRLALNAHPTYADAYYHLGNIFTKKNKLPEAIKYYLEAIKYQPQHSEAHSHLAQIYQQQNKITEAIDHYQKSIDVNPHHANTQINLGSLLVKQGDFADAVKHFEQALETEPKNIDALFNVGTTLILLNKPDEALKYFMQLLPLQPEAETYYNIGVIYMAKDRHQDAIYYFNEAVKKKPDYFDALLNLGATYLKIENYSAAIENYEKAGQLQPDNKEVQYILKALQQHNAPDAAPPEYLKHLFDQYAPYFEKHLEYLDYKVPQLLFSAVVEEIGKPEKSLEILDLGCGTGLAGEKFHPLAKRLIGIDLSEKMLDVAKQKSIYDELKVADVEQALEEFHHLDLIIAADVFTYIGNLELIFKKASQALKNKGIFAFTTEKTAEYPFILQQSARYAHNKQYIEELAAQNELKILHFSSVILRTQKNQPVEGYLFVLRS